MATLDIEYRYTCPSNIHWEKKVIGSKGDLYTVTYDGGHYDPWRCSCPGFQYRGECKHIKAAEKERCGWAWESFCGDRCEPKKDPKKPGGFGLCPICNEPVEVIRVGV